MGAVIEKSNTYLVYIGVDIGQSQDPTAIVVADPEVISSKITSWHFLPCNYRRGNKSTSKHS